jgi:hypothetical protein
MPILIDNKESDDMHPTIFGFPTKNGFAAKALNSVYVIVMVVAMCFAFHALGLILPDWNPGVIFLAALAVVGLPYCIKIIMYGKHEFEYKYAVLCIIISLLPTIFDFVGFYSETSIRTTLQKTKFEVLEVVNYFDKDARTSINKEILALENETNRQYQEVETAFNNSIKELGDTVNDAEQDFIDETQGVKGKSTTGTAGMGPKAKELESNLRKATAKKELDKKQIEANKQKELDRIKRDYDAKLKSLQEGLKSIDSLMTTNNDGEGLIFEVNKSKSFSELADVSIKVNNAINVVGSKLKVEPQYIKFDTDNVINSSFSALMRGDITALVCFALALLLEVVDTVIVYMVRGVKKEKKKKIDEPVNNVRETIHYNF